MKAQGVSVKVETARLTISDLRIRTPLGFESEPLTLELSGGELGLITGPGGTGKSLLLEHLVGIQRPGTTKIGRFELSPHPPRGASGTEQARCRGPALVPQDARLAALPTDKVLSFLGGREAAERWLPRVGLDATRLRSLTMRELSVGERKRVLFAHALGSGSPFLFFDGYGEALDPESRGRVLDLLEGACAEGKIVLVTTREPEPAGVVAQRRVRWGADEEAAMVPLLRRSESPHVPHKHALIEAQRLTIIRGRRGLFGRRPRAIPIGDATLYLKHGETLVLLGPCGSGKTTLLEAIAGLRSPARGRVRISGVDVSDSRSGQLHRVHRQAQLVFQDAMAILDGERTVEEHLLEASRLSRKGEIAPSVWLERVGLAPRLLTLPADVLSASEAARVDLARSLAVSPGAILFDEPRDAAVGVDGGVLTSLISSEKAKGTSFLLATSEPELARVFADRIAILDSGFLIEMGPRDSVLGSPSHPRTRAILDGTARSSATPGRLPGHCPFEASCPRRIPLCGEEMPLLRPVPGAQHHRVLCFNPGPK